MVRPLALLCLLLAGPLAAQEPPPPPPAPVRLEYAFERLDKKTAVYELETEQVVGQEVRGLTAGRKDQPQSLSGEARTRVLERQAWRFERQEDGGGRIQVTTERVEVGLEEKGKPARTYSSDHPARAPERIRPLLAKAGKAVTLVVTRAGVVSAVEGVPEAQQASYKGTLLELPAEPLAPGAGWDRLETGPMPPLGAIEYRFHYQLAAVEPARRRLEVSIRAALQDDPGQRLYDADLTGQEGRGWLLLDPDGLVLESLLETRLELTIKSAEGTQVQRLRNRTRQVLKETRTD